MDFSTFFSSFNTYLITALLIVAFSIGAFSFYKLSKWLQRYRVKKKFKIGEQGEVLARDFLINNGFTILEEQPICHATMWVDDQERNYYVKADFLVEKDDCKAIVEVKTGSVATNPASIHTRRQLFEYTHLYKIDDILFFNAETRELSIIKFEQPAEEEPQPAQTPWWLLWLGIILGAAIIILSLALALYYNLIQLKFIL